MEKSYNIIRGTVRTKKLYYKGEVKNEEIFIYFM